METNGNIIVLLVVAGIILERMTSMRDRHEPLKDGKIAGIKSTVKDRSKLQPTCKNCKCQRYTECTCQRKHQPGVDN